MSSDAMPLDRFWNIIGRAARRDADENIAALHAGLRELTHDDLIAFEKTFRRLLNEAYTWDLWGAAFVIHGGCSDDGFEYFRRWLVSRGRAIYEAALVDPDSLASVDDAEHGPDGVWEFEDYYYVVGDVFTEKGGEGDVRDHSEDEAGLSVASNPSGQPFQKDEQHLAQRYPRLWKRFGHDPQV